MTKKEYIDKWSEECLKCNQLCINWKGQLFCLWAKNTPRCGFGGYSYTAKNTDSAKKFLSVALLDENFVSKTCPMYTERMIELFSLDDDQDDLTTKP